ncbi:MAG: MBL fold metallo-hydrolase [Gammaproteobacteria bacterium]|nr:MBL fold metallo-hydrolase [Gammaproteobacteria bacterium]
MRLLALLLCLLSASVLQAASLVVVDVGEGQALFLQQGEEALLIDTGHAGQASHLLQRLRAHGVSRLHALVLTHLHPDHASGYFRLREAFPEAPVMESGHPLPEAVSPDMVRWVRDGLQRDPHRRLLKQGDVLSWGELRIEVLWPQGFANNNLNLHSLVLQVTAGDRRVVIMGDAPSTVGRRLLNQDRFVSDIDILVVGHHGAADSGDEAVLRHLRPRYSLISVNADNIRGYPSAQTLQRLHKYSDTVLRTDIEGELCFSLAPQTRLRMTCP